MKTCSRCGIERPLEDFRTYYNAGSTSQYKYCKECESIESRRKYLVGKHKKNALTVEQLNELQSIEQLYAIRGAKGLDVPGKSRSRNATASLVAKYINEEGRG